MPVARGLVAMLPPPPLHPVLLATQHRYGAVAPPVHTVWPPRAGHCAHLASWGGGPGTEPSSEGLLAQDPCWVSVASSLSFGYHQALDIQGLSPRGKVPGAGCWSALPCQSLRPWAGLTASPVRGDTLVKGPQPAPSPAPGRWQLRPRPQAIWAVLASLGPGRDSACVGTSHQLALQPRRSVQARLPSHPLPPAQTPCSHGAQGHVQSRGPDPLGRACLPLVTTGCRAVVPITGPCPGKRAPEGPRGGAGWGRPTRALRPDLWFCSDRPVPSHRPLWEEPTGPFLVGRQGSRRRAGRGQPGVPGPH